MTPNAKDVDDRLAAKWTLGQFDEACLIIRDELAPIIRDDLLARNELTLSYEDAEDLVQEVFQGFCARVREGKGRPIRSPRAYLWQGVLNRALRKSQKNKAERRKEFPASGETDDDLTVEDWFDHEQFQAAPARTFGWDERAKFVIEGIFESEDITASAAAQVVKTALERLDADDRAIIECILEYGPGQSATLGGERLRISAQNYRVRKFRTYKLLKTMIPDIAVELGVQVTRYEPETEAEAEIYEFQDSADSEEDDNSL